MWGSGKKLVRDSLKDKFYRQRAHAQRRGIDFLLTFDQWINWWGEDIDKRGRGMGKLQMCRKEDKGAYELGNIFKSTHEQNQRDKKMNGTHGAKAKVVEKSDIDLIHEAYGYGYTTREIARAMNISQRTVCRVLNRQGAYK